MAIVVGTNSWVTEAEADTYFVDRVKASDYWTTGGSDNSPALITAYKWLNSGRYSFPTVATQAIKDAQCETAFFFLQHQPDLDLRMGLRAQGVLGAGVVKERYRDKDYIGLPIPPLVRQLLSAYDTERPVYMVNMARNPEEGVDYDAFANRNTDAAND